MNSEPIRTDATTAEVWQTAQHRRAADIATLFGDPAGVEHRPPAIRRRLVIPTVFASLVVGVAVWAIAGPAAQPTKTLVAIKYARAH